MHSVNGAKFLNNASLFLSPESLAVCLAAAITAPSAPLIIIASFTSMYASL